MKLPFWLYALLRVLGLALAILTSPVWLPIVFVLWAGIEIFGALGAWFSELRRDWDVLKGDEK